MTDTLRRLGLVTLATGAGAIAAGGLLGFAVGASPLRYAAYGLDVGGAGMIAVAFFTAAPPSGRQRHKLRAQGPEAEAAAAAGRTTLVELLLLVAAGALLLVLGTLLENAI